MLAVIGGPLLVAIAGHEPLPPPPPPTAEQIADKARADAAVQRALLGAMMLKQAARNPDSFKLEAALVMKSGAVCFQYRAQNGFGGMNVGNAVMKADSSKLITSDMDDITRSWNSLCVNKPLQVDATTAIRWKLS